MIIKIVIYIVYANGVFQSGLLITILTIVSLLTFPLVSIALTLNLYLHGYNKVYLALFSMLPYVQSLSTPSNM